MSMKDIMVMVFFPYPPALRGSVKFHFISYVAENQHDHGGYLCLHSKLSCEPGLLSAAGAVLNGEPEFLRLCTGP